MCYAVVSFALVFMIFVGPTVTAGAVISNDFQAGRFFLSQRYGRLNVANVCVIELSLEWQRARLFVLMDIDSFQNRGGSSLNCCGPTLVLLPVICGDSC